MIPHNNSEHLSISVTITRFSWTGNHIIQQLCGSPSAVCPHLAIWITYLTVGATRFESQSVPASLCAGVIGNMQQKNSLQLCSQLPALEHWLICLDRHVEATWPNPDLLFTSPSQICWHTPYLAWIYTKYLSVTFSVKVRPEGEKASPEWTIRSILSVNLG